MTPSPTTAAPAERPPLRIGALTVDPPVVLAPMAGVTNAPFRSLCRSFGGGLFVSEMLMARAVVHGSRRTTEMTTFWPDDRPRSVQLYAVDPHDAGAATTRLIGDHGVDHVDLNFGCPAPKVTRHGGGAALPLKPRLLAAIVDAVVRAAGPVPVTMKFRIGVDDARLTHLVTGRIAQDHGCAAVALHARTAAQRYSGTARWSAIGELKEAVTAIPVLGNGDVWEASDALAMQEQTGCDGVVVGRGCLGRPWLFAELEAAFAGRPAPASPPLGGALAVLRRHGELLTELMGPQRALRDLRKHAGWYLTGYPVGPAVRRDFAMVSTMAELDALIAQCDPAMVLLPGGNRLRRGHTDGPHPVPLPEGFLDDPDALAIDPLAALSGSGG